MAAPPLTEGRMFYVTIYMDRSVSFSYSSPEKLNRHTSHLKAEAHSIVFAKAKNELDSAIKDALRYIPRMPFKPKS